MTLLILAAATVGRIVMGPGRVPELGRSLAELFPDIAQQWHPKQNGDVHPDAVRPNYREKVWWVCPECGHEYPMAPRVRTAKPFSGCPPCSYRRAGVKLRRPLPGESLQEVRPDVAAQWHPTKNGDTTPSDVSRASRDKAWWLCADCGHVWEAAIANRTSGKQTKCPECNHRRKGLPRQGQSLADLHPNLMPEWHPTKNAGLFPQQLKPGSHKPVWWRCSRCGHEWPAAPLTRTKQGSGCRPCSYITRIAARDVPKPGQSFAELFPDIAAQWHPTKNNRRPEELKPGSDIKAWWVCPRRGHEWEARVYTRTGSYKTGCPHCRDMPEEGQSLADLYPSVAAEWHPTKNDRRPEDYRSGSAESVWWKCKPRGHVWESTISNRTAAGGRSCPKCTLWGVSEQEIRLRYELEAAGCLVDHDFPRITVSGRPPVNADIVMPDYRVVIEFDGARYHGTPEAAVRDRTQSDALSAAGWTVIRVRQEPLQLLDLHDVQMPAGSTTKHTALLVLQKLIDLGFRPSKSAAYQEDPNPWATAEADSVIYRHHKRSLATAFPDLAKEWDTEHNGDIIPEQTNPGSREPVWWVCATCSHEWKTSPKCRTTGGSGCPRCARQRGAAANRTPSPGRSAADLRPDLLRIWDVERNGSLTLYDLKLGTATEVHWRCPDCGHRWKIRPRRTGCRPCAVRRRAIARRTPPSGQSFGELHAELATTWHPRRNGDLTPSQVNPGYSRKVWWLCPHCAHEWPATVAARVKNGRGCPPCAYKKSGLARRRPTPGKSLRETHPLLAEQWCDELNGALRPENVKANSTDRAWWECPDCGRQWETFIWARALQGHGCRACSSVKRGRDRKPQPGNTIVDMRPDLLLLWHPTRNTDVVPTDISPSSHRSVFWLCPDCGHEWDSRPANAGCRPCGSRRTGAKLRRVKPGNSLTERAPELAAQWHPKLNGAVTPSDINAGSSDNYWWQCSDCGYEWQARLTNRTRQVYLCFTCKTRM
ncbi:hypothetical protein IU459_31800 [Nocardia amamiensis]|uniref:Treble clef zinc finger domain-containing protein n=1 Tax=Nocardia amamiensis TaxID=404578 RepID=A0ABS0CZU2_9NOCA|nr:hypothetical protein [Nocardia amamiensis]